MFTSVVFIGARLFVSRIMQNLLDRFPYKSVDRWHMGHGRNHLILVVIQYHTMLRCQLGEASSILQIDGYVSHPIFELVPYSYSAWEDVLSALAELMCS